MEEFTKFNTSQDAYISLRNKIAERADDIIAWVGAGINNKNQLSS